MNTIILASTSAAEAAGETASLLFQVAVFLLAVAAILMPLVVMAINSKLGKLLKKQDEQNNLLLQQLHALHKQRQ